MNRLQGTLDMLVLKSLALAELHGLGISPPHRANHQGNVSSQAWLALPGFASHGGTRVAGVLLGRVGKQPAPKYCKLTSAGAGNWKRNLALGRIA